MASSCSMALTRWRQGSTPTSKARTISRLSSWKKRHGKTEESDHRAIGSSGHLKKADAKLLSAYKKFWPFPMARCPDDPIPRFSISGKMFPTMQQPIWNFEQEPVVDERPDETSIILRAYSDRS